jgi:hypothetical protein
VVLFFKTFLSRIRHLLLSPQIYFLYSESLVEVVETYGRGIGPIKDKAGDAKSGIGTQ